MGDRGETREGGEDERKEKREESVGERGEKMRGKRRECGSKRGMKGEGRNLPCDASGSISNTSYNTRSLTSFFLDRTK